MTLSLGATLGAASLAAAPSRAAQARAASKPAAFLPFFSRRHAPALAATLKASPRPLAARCVGLHFFTCAPADFLLFLSPYDGALPLHPFPRISLTCSRRPASMAPLLGNPLPLSTIALCPFRRLGAPAAEASLGTSEFSAASLRPHRRQYMTSAAAEASSSSSSPPPPPPPEEDAPGGGPCHGIDCESSHHRPLLSRVKR